MERQLVAHGAVCAFFLWHDGTQSHVPSCHRKIGVRSAQSGERASGSRAAICKGSCSDNESWQSG